VTLAALNISIKPEVKMANKFSDQLGGFISLCLKGNNLEKIINLALARGIYIWDIKRDGNHIYLKVRTSGYEAFKSIADEHHYELQILQRQGLPFYKTVMKRRMGLIGGGVLLILVLYLMSSFVWFVQVSGNNKVDRNRILLTAARYGVYVGAAKWDFSRTEVEEAMLRELSEIAYIQCDIKGVKANIKVVEKILPDLNVELPCHMIAARDGVVEDLLVLDGQATVKKGDVVAKGDILISGIVLPPAHKTGEGTPPTQAAPYHVRARGQVKARTWYEGYGECKLKTEEKVFSGKEITKIYLERLGKQFIIKGRGENPFAIFEQSEKVWHSPLGNWSIYKVKIKEQTIKTTELSEKEAVEIAREKALKLLHQQMNASLKTSDSHMNILSSPSDSIVRIKVSVESIEDICQAQPINGGQISN
jgi:similar to stage IV sporulation protein